MKSNMSTSAFIYGTRGICVNTVPFQSFLHPPRTIDLTPVATLESRDILRSILGGYDHHRILLQLRLNKETLVEGASLENGIA